MRSPQSASGSVVVCGTTTAGQGRHVAVRFLKPVAEAGGKGVHFSNAGLRAHAAVWMEKIAPWLEEQTPRP